MVTESSDSTVEIDVVGLNESHPVFQSVPIVSTPIRGLVIPYSPYYFLHAQPVRLFSQPNVAPATTEMMPEPNPEVKQENEDDYPE